MADFSNPRCEIELIIIDPPKAIFISDCEDHSDFQGDASAKESTCQCRRPRRHGVDPWVGKIP